MKKKLFAAIDVGSYELSMKIYEISSGKEWKQIDYIRHRIDLGTDSYSRGILSYERMDELCHVLREFKKIMDSYKVDDYKAYGTSAIRELHNTIIILDQIKNRTGLDVGVLSNSEQRFLDYKSVASAGAGFETIIGKGTAILDIGGGSIQLSLFDKDTTNATHDPILSRFLPVSVIFGLAALHEAKKHWSPMIPVPCLMRLDSAYFMNLCAPLLPTTT